MGKLASCHFGLKGPQLHCEMLIVRCCTRYLAFQNGSVKSSLGLECLCQANKYAGRQVISGVSSVSRCYVNLSHKHQEVCTDSKQLILSTAVANVWLLVAVTENVQRAFAAWGLEVKSVISQWRFARSYRVQHSSQADARASVASVASPR